MSIFPIPLPYTKENPAELSLSGVERQSKN